MRTTLKRSLMAGMALWAVVAWAPARADDDEALRKRALGFNKVTGDDPIKGEVKALLADKATAKKLLAVAAKMAEEKKQPFNYNGAIILAETADKLGDLDQARAFYKICTQEATRLLSGQKLAESYSNFIDLLFRHRKYEEAAKVCQEFLDLPDPDQNPGGPINRLKPVVLIQMILGLAQQGKVDEATKMIDKFLKDQPRNWLLLEVKAQVEREAGRIEEAAKLYEEVLDRIAKDKEASQEEKNYYLRLYRYRLSNLYVDLKKIDKAAEQLKKLLEMKPDSPTFYNDLGYIWADNDMNLDEAEKLIRKALNLDREQRKKIPDLTPEEDRDNAAYLDSLGWVLFKKKNYKEAKEWLEKASKEKDGEHVEILDHLGDACLALGEKEQAIAAWEKALKATPQGKRDEQRKEEVKKKLEEHKK